MKKELLVSVLSLSATMATTMTYTAPALARSTRLEKEFAKEFLLKSPVSARFKNSDGKYVEGHVFLQITQEGLNPIWQNQLHGEMRGVLYFESNDKKTYEFMTSDDGFVLLDLLHKDAETGRTYQIYGCNSTLTSCSAELIQINFKKNQSVGLTITLPEDSSVQFLTEERFYDADGKMTSKWDWTTSAWSSMHEVPLENE